MRLLLKSPVTSELRPRGYPAASLNNVYRQSLRSTISYSAVTTRRHLHLSNRNYIMSNSAIRNVGAVIIG